MVSSIFKEEIFSPTEFPAAAALQLISETKP